MKWLLDFSIRNGITSSDDHNSCLNAVMKIRRDGCVQIITVKCPEDPTGRAFCFPLGHNKSEEGLKAITKERIERLQQAMGMEDPPQWYVRS